MCIFTKNMIMSHYRGKLEAEMPGLLAIYLSIYLATYVRPLEAPC